MADAGDLKSPALWGVWVQLPSQLITPNMRRHEHANRAGTSMGNGRGEIDTDSRRQIVGWCSDVVLRRGKSCGLEGKTGCIKTIDK